MVLDSGSMLTPLCTLVLEQPQSLIAFAVLAFAAGMFPVGLMFGSECSRCCGVQCQQCVTGALPRTITVSFSGLDGCCYGNRSFVLTRIESDITQGVNYVPEMIEQDCVYGRPLCFLPGETGNRIFVAYNGPASPPTAGLVSAKAECNAEWTASENIEDCSQFGFEVTNEDGQTISVTAGGDYDEWHELPETATITLNNFPNITKAYKVSESGSFTVVGTCFGSGAGGVGLEPGGIPGEDEGPLSSIELTNGGSGYAILGRVEPLVTAEALEYFPEEITTNPEFDITWGTETDECGRTTWSVESLSVTAAGDNVRENTSVVFTASEGDTVVVAAEAYCVITRAAPEITASVGGGSGAVLEVTLTDGGPYWGVASIAVIDGGSGYSEEDAVEFSYAPDDIVNNTVWAPPQATIEVDESGVITAVTVTQAGEVYKSLGVASVVVTEPGEYYRESSAVAAIVSPTTITFTGASGNGATLSATVDPDPGSATFGQVTSVSITNGGSGYLLYEWAKTCCGDYYDGLEITLARGNELNGFAGDPECQMWHSFCGVGNLGNYPGYAALTYYGPNTPPVVGIVSENIGNSNMCNVDMTTDESICGDDLSFTATNVLNNQTADVAEGGQYDEFWRNPDDPAACDICCRGEEEPPDEIEVEIEDRRVETGLIEEFGQDEDFSGTYILERRNAAPGEYNGVLFGANVGTSSLMYWIDVNRTAASATFAVIVRAAEGPKPVVGGPGGQQYDHWEQVELNPTAGWPLDPNGPLAFPDVCDFCHTKCFVYAEAILFGASGAPRGTLFKFNMCADALDTPLCRPPAGVYATNIKRRVDGGFVFENDDESVRITVNE